VNPKLAVLFVALSPQFIPDGAPVLPYTSTAFVRRVEQVTGAALLVLAGRLAAESR
jgi:threonine/homoserine/homoserine lactone efflux protein